LQGKSVVCGHRVSAMAAPRAFLPLILVVAVLVAMQLRGRGSQLPLGIEGSSPPASDPAPSPLALAAQYVTLDVAYLRWLWWPVILYLFWGMAYVCDVYFVRTIDVISERFQIPDDVAGATLMALGCNGPEMALNTIAIFHPSNIGVGAVIGGEVFNVLVIIGAALLATPAAYLPLKLGRFNFFRDVLFYVGSVAVLYWVLHDGSITRVNAAVLLLGAVCYTLTVTFSSKIRSLLSRQRRHARNATRRLTRNLTKHLSLAEQIRNLPEAQEDYEEEEEFPAADPEMVAQWTQSRSCAEPGEGSVLGVRVDVRNRLMDRNHRMEERYVWLREDALLVSTVMDPTEAGQQQLRRADTGAVQEGKKWHHGGLVNQPVVMISDLEAAASLEATALNHAFSATPLAQLSRPLLNEPPKRSTTSGSVRQLPPSLELPGFKEAPWEVIPLQDVLYCEAQGDLEHFALHVHQHDSELGSLITVEFSAKEPNVLDAWVGSLCKALKEQRRQTSEAPQAKSNTATLMEWVEWIQFPVKFALKMTIPDMDNPKLQHWYPLSFTMSMTWLAIFAYSVVAACDGIHADFGISDSVLGFTVAAAGTSFPNVFSGMVVARQGKTSMAVANALGANIQNVFLALAVPWTVQTYFIRGGPFPMQVDNLLPAVMECMITLLPVVLIYACCGSAMPGWSGGLFLATYLVYLVFALGQQVSACATWPFPCGAGP